MVVEGEEDAIAEGKGGGRMAFGDVLVALVEVRAGVGGCTAWPS